MALKEFTEEEIVAWTRRKLGGSSIDIEITTEDFTDALQSALSIFSKFKPLKMMNAIPVVPERERYQLCDFGSRGIYAVSVGSRNVLDLSHGFGFPIPYEYRIPGLEMEKYEAYLMWQETANNIYSAAFDWRFDPPYLHVTNVPSTATHIFYMYNIDHKLMTVPVTWQEWVKRWALAEARETLGEVREKFGNVPTAGGGVQLNGAQLKGEATAEKERLMVELEGGRGDLPPTWG